MSHNQTLRASSSFSLPSVKGSWSIADVRDLRELAQRGLSIAAIATRLRRSESAVRNKAAMHGISLRSLALTSVAAGGE